MVIFLCDNYRDFRGVLAYLKENQIKQETVANFLGIGRTTLNRKLNGASEFKLSEVKLIHEHFNVPLEIFFKDFWVNRLNISSLSISCNILIDN